MGTHIKDCLNILSQDKSPQCMRPIKDCLNMLSQDKSPQCMCFEIYGFRSLDKVIKRHYVHILIEDCKFHTQC